MGKKFALTVKIVNIGLALFLIGLSIYHIVTLQPFSDMSSLKFFNFFTPFFLILLGCMLIAAETKVEFITTYFKFLQTMIGRGIFNIYLASVALYIYQSSEVIGWIFGAIMFCFGLLYIGLHFCRSKDSGFENEV